MDEVIESLKPCPAPTRCALNLVINLLKQMINAQISDRKPGLKLFFLGKRIISFNNTKNQQNNTTTVQATTKPTPISSDTSPTKIRYFSKIMGNPIV